MLCNSVEQTKQAMQVAYNRLKHKLRAVYMSARVC